MTMLHAARPRATPFAAVAAAITMTISLTTLALAGAQAQQLPSFKVTGQYETDIALLVPKNTSNEQLKALVLALRDARRENRLGALIPPTTPGGTRGPYGIVVAYVYSDPRWATSESLRKCTNASPRSSLYADCGGHVSAYYFYTAMSREEEGSLGYAEGGTVFTKVHQRLF